MVDQISAAPSDIGSATNTVRTAPPAVAPPIRKVGVADVRDALVRGLDDFRHKPSHMLILAVLYPVVGLIAARFAAGYDVLPLLYPMVAGFALIAPIAALGFAEISRRREAGETVAWTEAFQVVRSQSFWGIATLAAVLGVVFVMWLTAADLIYRATLGATAEALATTSLSDLIALVFTTTEGWVMLLVGNTVGFLFALFVLGIATVSFPLLLDHPVPVVVAVDTSMRALLSSPLAMIAWGLVVALSLFVASIPFFVGIAVVLPVLGHATWHLYRRVVAD